ncbi:MAG: RagB/SusD family nutrient uptake outer membrane protein [Bacteroidales bacterium]|nr:RagB/SusD family nutrient uptake outer membrane protein [Bacteroidales bacterium]
MKKHICLASLMALGLTLNSCDDLLEPAIENTNSLESYYKDPTHYYGSLMISYYRLPFADLPDTDLATDDAVTNDLNSGWLKMATGSWTSSNNPVSKWDQSYYSLQIINTFIENLDKVEWYHDDVRQNLQVDHYLGQAYALRAIFHYYLLQAHGGPVNGNLTGVLVHTASENGATDFNQSRASWKETYDAIMTDLDAAIERLPDQFLNEWTEDQIPQRLKDMGANTSNMYRINGPFSIGSIDGRICKTYKAMASLMAASPAFEQDSWKNAAQYAEERVKSLGGRNRIDKRSIDWFADTVYVKDAKTTEVPSITIWYTGISNDNGWEKTNYPNSLSGQGRTNPSQNLVDAFPMANGYPITDSKSGYDPKNPYAGRDPRLDLYILRDGGIINGTEICTAEDSETKDGLNVDKSTSTRTGYYMKKLLHPNASPAATGAKKENHIQSKIRVLEPFLIYAEAKNEADGPMAGSPSPYEVIKQIRQFSGITDGDQYLESIKNDKDKMRDMIRNERRICFCFENKRFWDLRRWNDIEALKAPVMGMRINGAAGSKTYEPFEVESRDFQAYQIYGPVPYSDVTAYSNLKQNDGWN